jgi:hypothetical protein
MGASNNRLLLLKLFYVYKNPMQMPLKVIILLFLVLYRSVQKLYGIFFESRSGLIFNSKFGSVWQILFNFPGQNSHAPHSPLQFLLLDKFNTQM